MRVTISGPPGSGKTTVCLLLAERMGSRCVISGHVFREMAAEMGMTLSEFGALCASDISYDRRIDDRMVGMAAADDTMILEGRLTAHMLTRQGIPAHRVYLTAPVEVRARRISGREGDGLEAAMADITDREGCEVRRYKEHYDIDLEDMTVYDQVIDTSDLTPEGVAVLIAAGMGWT